MQIIQKFIIPGKPVPKARHQVRFWHGGVMTYTPAKTREFEKKVRVYAIKQRIRKQEGSLATVVVFRTNGTGDLDNLLKSLLDGLNGLAWEDDRQVVGLVAVKLPRHQTQEEQTQVVILPAEKFMREVGKVMRKMGLEVG